MSEACDGDPSAPPSREQLLYWLHEAAEIEHHLMCCYLYAAFSLKVSDAAWTVEQTAAVGRWRHSMMAVAIEEMSHLALVANLANALGGTPHLNRPPFPVDAGPYPAGFVIRLAPFSRATIEHFKFLERPVAQEVADAAAFAPAASYRRAVPAGRLSPGPRDYHTVGELYAVLDRSLVEVATRGGEPALFIGDPARQVDAALVPLPGVTPVTDLASARQAIRTIVTQGEGAGAEASDSHFSRFTRIESELAALLQADPSFAPAWPAAENPVMNAPVVAQDRRVHVDHPVQSRWLDIGNALYTTSLRCLLQGFDARGPRAKATWLAASFALMRALVPVGQGLAARPARADGSGPHAGLTFTPLRTLARLPEDRAVPVICERLGQLRERATALPLDGATAEEKRQWAGVIAALSAQEAALRGLASEPGPAMAVAAATTAPATAAVLPGAPPPAAAAPADGVEIVEGKALTLMFEGRRCIHSRHCVLEAPAVFLANTPGAWIFPDAMHGEAVVGVAHRCPSGAIRYQRRDGGPQEAPPPVNTLRIRENGPYALSADLRISGRPDGYRVTLCRCGQSKNKPWCDGSHAAAQFNASGEPPSGDVTAQARRDGPLEVTPLRDGPLRVDGNLEICAGTGRPIARVTSARLCRCGNSKNKPFCDGSHRSAGFAADGA